VHYNIQLTAKNFSKTVAAYGPKTGAIRRSDFAP